MCERGGARCRRLLQCNFSTVSVQIAPSVSVPFLAHGAAGAGPPLAASCRYSKPLALQARPAGLQARAISRPPSRPRAPAAPRSPVFARSVPHVLSGCVLESGRGGRRAGQMWRLAWTHGTETSWHSSITCCGLYWRGGAHEGYLDSCGSVWCVCAVWCVSGVL